MPNVLKKIGLVAIIVAVICSVVLFIGYAVGIDGIYNKPNPMVIEAQQAFDHVMAGEEVLLKEIRLIHYSGPGPFIDVWCDEHGLEGEAAQQKRDELFRAYQNLKVKLGEPVAEAESSAEEK